MKMNFVVTKQQFRNWDYFKNPKKYKNFHNPEIFVNKQILENKYCVVEHIGGGSYGHVYKVKRNSDERIFAAKIEIESAHGKLKNENSLLIKLQGSQGICKMEEFSVHYN
jgi:hypothetical protein